MSRARPVVAAVVEAWPEESMDVKEGSRHRLRIAGSTTTGWISLKGGGKEGEPERDNLRAANLNGTIAEDVEDAPAPAGAGAPAAAPAGAPAPAGASASGTAGRGSSTAAKPSDDVEGEAEEAEEPEYWCVVSSKPLLVRAGCEKHTDTVGTLHPGTMVRVLEYRETADGIKRAFVD
jgi:hypothetical protein